MVRWGERGSTQQPLAPIFRRRMACCPVLKTPAQEDIQFIIHLTAPLLSFIFEIRELIHIGQAAHAQFLLQRLPAIMQPRLDRANRDLEDF